MAENLLQKENIYNAPNFITVLRIVLTVAVIYLVFTNAGFILIAAVFFVAMITDALDGFVARRFNTATEFGRKFDMAADRILMIGTALSFILKFYNQLSPFHFSQVVLILTREIICAPFVVWGLIFKRGFPKVMIVGKITTVLQAFAFPVVVLSIFSRFFSFSIYLSILTAISGIISSFFYIKNILKKP